MARGCVNKGRRMLGQWARGRAGFKGSSCTSCLLVCRVDVRCFVEGMETQGAVGRETMAGLMVRREDRQMGFVEGVRESTTAGGGVGWQTPCKSVLGCSASQDMMPSRPLFLIRRESCPQYETAFPPWHNHSTSKHASPTPSVVVHLRICARVLCITRYDTPPPSPGQSRQLRSIPRLFPRDEREKTRLAIFCSPLVVRGGGGPSEERLVLRRVVGGEGSLELGG